MEVSRSQWQIEPEKFAEGSEHISKLNLLEPLCETESEEKAQEQYGLLLEKAKSGTTGLECLRSFWG